MLVQFSMPINIVAASGVTPPSTPGYSGQISVNGNVFVNGANGAGLTLLLKGVNNSGLETDGVQGRQPWGGNPPDWTTLGVWGAGMAGTQSALITRIPLNSASFLGLTTYAPTNSTTWGAQNNAGVGNGTADPFANYKAAIITAINACRAINCYIILDLHWVSTQLTLGGVTHYATYIGQNGFMDQSNGLTFWTDSVQSLPVWLATTFGSGAFNTAHGYNGGAAGAQYNSAYGGASGFGDIVFELFNEPFLGTGTYSAGSADLTLLNGGTGNTYITNGGGNITTTVTYTGYQACISGIRALGMSNPIIFNGNGYSSQLQHISTWQPTDTLATPQLAAGWHPYSQQPYASLGTNPYPGTGSDTGSSTSTAVQWAQAVLTAGQPVIITEDGNDAGNNGGSNATSGEPHMSYMIAWASPRNVGYVPWTYGDGDYWAAYAATGTQNQILRQNSSSTGRIPVEGEGWVVYEYISGATAPTITTGTTLPTATQGSAYSTSLAYTGGTGTSTYSLVSASPDAGSWISVSSAGVISGTPGTAETESIVIQITDSVGIFTRTTFSLLVNSSGFTNPGLPQFFRMTNQGGSANTNTSTTEFTWSAATAGTYPIASYNIYRGTIVPGAGSPTLSIIGNTTGLAYTDSTATNVIQNNTTAPSTGYVYAITAVDTHSNEGAQQTQCYLYWYYEGTAFQSETNFSYGGATINWAATPPVAPPVGTVCISNVYGAAGGFQPVANNPVTPLYGTELGGFNYLIFDCLLGDATHIWQELNLSRPGYGSGGGGADIQPAGGSTITLVTNTTSAYGSPSTSAWATLKVPLSTIQLGVTQFMGYMSGTTVTATSIISGPGIDSGGYITGAGVPAGTYVSTAPGSTSGPWTTNNSATVGSAGSPILMTGYRTAVYKLNFLTNTGGSTLYLNNIGFCVN
jgi:Cellulase (glycosyl hydrolase family 5)